MMRYQRVSPDYLPLANTKKPYLRPSPSRSNENGRSTANATATTAGGGRFNGTSTSISNSNLDGVPKGFRFRSSPITTTTIQQQQDLPHDSTANLSRNGGAGGDGLLQWGQRKRSRASRAEIRSVSVAAADDSSSSSGQSLIPPPSKLQRRSSNPSMPPPSPSRTTNPRNGIVIGKESSRFVPTRHLEDRSATGSPSRNIGVGGGSGRMVSRSANAGSKRSPPSPDKTETRSNGKDHHHHHQRQNGLDQTHHHNQRMNRSESTAQIHSELETSNGEKTAHVEVKEWPRIYIALSRKEKEEDFLAMKGTKLPHRPRKRAKNIDKGLQYCFPGMWLPELNKSRYEVREKKSVKKQQKRRGLKGMESLDSDSE
ncbi:unnamed protein product [Microthlaspi erraticum]|uniref:DUF1639 domain-containing protein n=1 Tax=Microthlaspi erraticum TaxID=1685480 RepID=A0A6D2L1C0_9BRAS|nr:unnamed protein product [Microthlaspi erraticum]